MIEFTERQIQSLEKPEGTPSRKRLVSGIAGAVFGGTLAYGFSLLLASWMESSNPVARGHGVDIFALFELWVLEFVAFYCVLPLAALVGAIAGAIYLPKCFCRSSNG
jgi:hypothetical protein